MNAKAMVPLVLAVVLGLTAALLVRSAMSHHTAAPVATNNLVTVVVAKQDADPGHALTADDLGTAKVSAEAAPGGVFSDPAQVVGRVNVTPLVRGQTVLESLLAPTGVGSGLQALVPAGMRAITLEVSEYSAVGGMLEPGCRVDVIGVLHDDRQKQQVARTVLQNIKISAVGRSIAPSRPSSGQPVPPPSNSITLLCTPKQAQILQLATNMGRPWLVLRSGRDVAESPVDSTTMAELQGNPDPTTQPAEGVANAAAPTPATPVVDPVPADATAAVPPTLKRTMTVMNGNVETQVVVTIPNPQAAVVAPLDTDHAIPNGN